MLSAWLGIACIIVSGVLLTLHARRTWPPHSLGGALTGLAHIITAFVLIGAAAVVPVSPDLWVGMTPTCAVWAAITTATCQFILGVLAAGPWFVTSMHSEAQRERAADETPPP